MTFTFDAPAFAKSSAVACVYGPTVDDPSAVIEPERALRLNVGFLTVEAATATDASTRHAATPMATAIPRRPSESFMSFPTPLSIPLTRRSSPGADLPWAEGP